MDQTTKKAMTNRDRNDPRASVVVDVISVISVGMLDPLKSKSGELGKSDALGYPYTAACFNTSVRT